MRVYENNYNIGKEKMHLNKIKISKVFIYFYFIRYIEIGNQR